MLGFSKQQQKAMKPGSLIMFSFSFTQNITYWTASFYLVAIVFWQTWLLISLWYGELVRVFQRIRKRKNGRYSPEPTLKVAIKTSVQIPLNKTQQCTPNEIQRRLCIFPGTHISLDLMMCTNERLKANHHSMEELENLTINLLMKPRIQNHKYFGTNNDHL